MKRSRKKAYLAVIGIGLVALVLDRVFSGGTPVAASGAVTSSGSSARARLAAHSDTAQLRVEVLPFPTNIPTAIIAGDERDPFDLTDEARAALFPPPPSESEAQQAESAVRPFDQRHVLSAIIRVGTTRIAIIDDLSVTTGQEVDGCLISSIDERTVKLTCPGGDQALSLAGPMGVGEPSGR
ncbi:MAG: hypothetical protein H6817_10370 [Phycisphaerales bacterium]|nr:hypothetical protein [Phycisphaerales bacterium]